MRGINTWLNTGAAMTTATDTLLLCKQCNITHNTLNNASHSVGTAIRMAFFSIKSRSSGLQGEERKNSMHDNNDALLWHIAQVRHATVASVKRLGKVKVLLSILLLTYTLLAVMFYAWRQWLHTRRHEEQVITRCAGDKPELEEGIGLRQLPTKIARCLFSRHNQQSKAATAAGFATAAVATTGGHIRSMNTYHNATLEFAHRVLFGDNSVRVVSIFFRMWFSTAVLVISAPLLSVISEYLLRRLDALCCRR